MLRTRQRLSSSSIKGQQLQSYRVSKSGNIHNWLSKTMEKPFLINHRILNICIFRRISACFLKTMICFPVKQMLVFLCYLLHVHYIYIIIVHEYAYLFDQFCIKYGRKICFLNDKKQVFILKFY